MNNFIKTLSLTALTLVSMSTLAEGNKVKSRATCEDLYEHASYVMTARQEDMSKEDLEEYVEDHSGLRALMNYAYLYPVYTNSLSAQDAIEDFANKFYMSCLSDFKGVK